MINTKATLDTDANALIFCIFGDPRGLHGPRIEDHAIRLDIRVGRDPVPIHAESINVMGPGLQEVMAALAAVRVARTIYHGRYEGLGSAWGELAPRGLRPTGTCGALLLSKDLRG